jgi:hypothetical protein
MKYEGIEQVYSHPLVISQNDEMVIDFYTETFGPLVPDVVNTIYFQAWATQDRADVFEFREASLKADRDDNKTLFLIE